MTSTCLFFSLAWLTSLLVMAYVNAEEPSYNQQVMKVCRKQQTTEQLMYSFEVSSLTRCAMRCTSEKACKSANLCSVGGSTVCTLSERSSENKCHNNTANDDCKYLITVTPCLHGGTVNSTGHCACAQPYTGEFCERLYYDCSEPGCVTSGETWIQRGGHTPFKVRCQSHSTYFLKYANIYTDTFPLNKTFDEYKSSFAIGNSFVTSGLEAIHIATSQAHYTLNVDIFTKTPFMNEYTAYYNFTLAPESERYRLDYSSKTPYGPDVFATMKGRPFSAMGNDPEGCFTMYNVAWWYTEDCGRAMIYNDNGKISVPDQNTLSPVRNADLISLFLQFEGLK